MVVWDSIVSTDEAVDFALKFGAVESMQRAKPVFDKVYRTHLGDGWHPDFALYSAVAAAYDMGRIQGIREERQKKKNKGL